MNTFPQNNTISDNAGCDVIELDKTTGEIIVSANQADYNKIQTTKIKALKLLNKNDFVNINGTYEAKRDALIKILSSLPINYAWEIKEKILDSKHTYSQILGTLTVSTGGIVRVADGIGICEFSELKGNGGLHFMNARAETRALKRAIETLFGSVINYFVTNEFNVANNNPNTYHKPTRSNSDASMYYR